MNNGSGCCDISINRSLYESMWGIIHLTIRLCTFSSSVIIYLLTPLQRLAYLSIGMIIVLYKSSFAFRPRFGSLLFIMCKTRIALKQT